MIPALPCELWELILINGGVLKMAPWVRVCPRSVASSRIQRKYRHFSLKRLRHDSWACGLRVLVWQRIFSIWRLGTLRRWHFASLRIDDWIVELDNNRGNVYLNSMSFPHPLLVCYQGP